MHLGLIAIVVREYDPAISFFVDVLGFELVEDSPARTNDGRPKRWVVVRPPGAATGLLLARADSEDQAAIVGKQAAGRVGFFLHVEDFDAAYRRMASAGVQFLTVPRTEHYGHVAVFLDIGTNGTLSVPRRKAGKYPAGPLKSGLTRARTVPPPLPPSSLSPCQRGLCHPRDLRLSPCRCTL